MTDTEAQTRRVRPWIAALLTLFLGWGTGFYYARQIKAAKFWAVASVVIGLATAAILPRRTRAVVAIAAIVVAGALG